MTELSIEFCFYLGLRRFPPPNQKGGKRLHLVSMGSPKVCGEASLTPCRELLQAILCSAQAAFQQEAQAVPLPTHGRQIEAVLFGLCSQCLTPADIPLCGLYYVHSDGSIFLFHNDRLRCVYQPPYPKLRLAPPCENVYDVFPQEKAE